MPATHPGEPEERLVSRPDKLPILGVKPRWTVTSRIHGPDVARQSVVICADLHLHAERIPGALETTRRLVEHAPVAVLTTAQPRAERGESERRARERGIAEFRNLLERSGLRTLFLGVTFSRGMRKASTMAIVTRAQPAPIVPASFKRPP